MSARKAAQRSPASGRRELAYAVLLCLVGAGLALWAVTRAWAVDTSVVGVPTPLVDEGRTGTQLLPWLPALALVGLAGGGAVLATRGRPRQVLGGLLALIGLMLAGGGGYGLVADLGDEVARQWPALTLIGGVLAAAGGVLTALRGRGWPAMGARYERRSRPSTPAQSPIRGAGTVDAWDALDRGEDPTVREDPTER
ncbi:Trp biosynthesis-associated membrane protein [Micromonospora craniellae]|uniref:Trp biosynthesis protein n=1 Tax=Micromonospora craniellae TaxID=2294034 RepID=A0A372G3E5_9ACTN|nr:Trp biosynthesis-associated membrane protein [Micromonospora craniellae]QOC91117.1 Trp biosynthesis-associated membrane protein [Micromonospora craniellae]RFS47240.1 Trp biosynthesis protein [Micromonospora craniellae]